jgi:hypothetical protein
MVPLHEALTIWHFSINLCFNCVWYETAAGRKRDLETGLSLIGQMKKHNIAHTARTLTSWIQCIRSTMSENSPMSLLRSLSISLLSCMNRVTSCAC